MQEDILMMKIAEGDEESFVRLYDMWSRRVMSFALRSLRDLHEAQDVVQETFIQVYKSAPTYRSEGKFGGYVLRIAGNLVRLRFRRSRPLDSLSEMLEDETAPHPESLSYSPEEHMIQGIDLDRLLGELPTRQKEALMLVAGGLSYAEASKVLAVTPDAFAQLVLRGRRTLKDKMYEIKEA